MPTYPLTTLDESTSFTTVRFSDRSKFGAARIWLPDIQQFNPDQLDGWSVVVRLHGGNGNDQGNLDPDASTFLLSMLNVLGVVVVSINWQDNGFYVPGGQDPRALFFPDGLLEPAMILPWLVARFADQNLFGPGGSITRDPNRMALFGMSDGGWRAGLLAYLRRNEFGLAQAVETLIGSPFVQPNVLISSQGHFDAEHFWMSEPIDGIVGWGTASASSAGARTIEIGGGLGTWRVGHELTLDFASERSFTYLVTGVAGNVLTIWPGLRIAVPAMVGVLPVDDAITKYSQGGYSWLGAPMFRAGGSTTWANWPADRKHEASLWPRITRDNTRIGEVLTLLLYPPDEPYVTNDDDPLSGWRSFVSHRGASPRYKSLHAEANGFALAGLLRDLGLTEGTATKNRFLLRAGGPRTNPDIGTRWINNIGQVLDAFETFLRNHGW